MSTERLDEVFARRLREIRGSRSQQEIVDRLQELGVNMSQVTLSKIERGTRKVTLAELAQFAAALGVSPLALLLDQRPAPPSEQRGVGVAPGLTLHELVFRGWLIGEVPLREEDLETYGRQHPFMRELFAWIGDQDGEETWIDLTVGMLESGALTEQHDSTVSAMAAYVRKLLAIYERWVHDAEVEADQQKMDALTREITVGRLRRNLDKLVDLDRRLRQLEGGEQ